MKKLFYLFCCMLVVLFAACDNGQPEGPSGDSNVPEKPSSPTTGSFVAKPFSVSPTKTVTFSPGNLQYHAANNEWRFAPSQLDYIGEANENISSTYNGWIDLFGWGTGNNPTNNSLDYEDYPTFVDWGVNQIGSYAPNTWCTLTPEEWGYLIEERPNNYKLKGVAQVNGVNGLILLPDDWDWTCPSGVTFKSGFHEGYYGTEYYAAYQTFSASDWSKLEAYGAVFLPAAGERYGSGVNNVQNYGCYWCAHVRHWDGVRYFYFVSHWNNNLDGEQNYGHSVRLVTTLVPPQEPNKPSDPSTPKEPSNPSIPSRFVAKPFSVSATKTVTFSPGNLQYHPVNDEWRFAPNQTDYIGDDNANISSSYNGWIDLFGWGTGDNPTNARVDYEDYPTFVDWGENRIGSYAPNTWRTLTSEEWYYLSHERPNYDKLIGVAQVIGEYGLILLPDNWTCPSGVTFRSGFYHNYQAHQIFGVSDWSKLESSGAVFLPAAGERYGSGVDNVQTSGIYWSATEYDSAYASFLYFDSAEAYMFDYVRDYGHSVRLVQD